MSVYLNLRTNYVNYSEIEKLC